MRHLSSRSNILAMARDATSLLLKLVSTGVLQPHFRYKVTFTSSDISKLICMRFYEILHRERALYQLYEVRFTPSDRLSDTCAFLTPPLLPSVLTRYRTPRTGFYPTSAFGYFMPMLTWTLSSWKTLCLTCGSVSGYCPRFSRSTSPCSPLRAPRPA